MQEKNTQFIFDFPVFFHLVLGDKKYRSTNRQEDIMKILFDLNDSEISAKEANLMKNGTTSSKNEQKYKDCIINESIESLAKRIQSCINSEEFNKLDFGRLKNLVDSLIEDREILDLFITIPDSNNTKYEALAHLFKFSVNNGFSRFDNKKLEQLGNVSENYNTLTFYLGSYYIYYHSYHYANEIHCGKMIIYLDKVSGEFKASLLLGLTTDEYYSESYFQENLPDNINSIDDLLLVDDEETSMKHLDSYLMQFNCIYDKRVFLYMGEVSVVGSCLQITLKKQRSDHYQIIYLNVARIKGSKNNSYKGGLGIVLALSNDSTRKIRAYNMGISDTRIPLDNPMLAQLLKLSPTSTERIEIPSDADSAFWNLILKAEKESLLNNPQC